MDEMRTQRELEERHEERSESETEMEPQGKDDVERPEQATELEAVQEGAETEGQNHV